MIFWENVMNHQICFCALLVTSVVLNQANGFTAEDWNHFRGSDSTGVATTEDLPLEWDVDKGTNVAWQKEIPGRGPSGPIVVDGKVFVSCSSGKKQDHLHVLCFDSDSGNALWHRQFWATGRTMSHPSSANAAPTPASDGQYVYAFYSSNDLICLDLDGNLLWYRGLGYDYPKAGNDVGMASSPVVVGNTIVVQVESQGDSFAAGLDKRTGETLWRISRDRKSNWTSPIAMPTRSDRPTQVLLQSSQAVSGYNAKTGEEMWRYDISAASIPSSVITSDRIYIPGDGMTVLQLAEGNPTPDIAWDSTQIKPGAASPVVKEGHIYAVNSAGVLVCADTRNGDVIWRLRLKGRFWATPVLVGSHLFCVNSDGLAQVVQLGEDEGNIVGTSNFGEVVQGTPAVADGGLFVRSDSHLWKIAPR